MAALEKRNISIEIRKLRKKLRQIEKLEEVERDLTEEEFQKISRKDEIRSSLQQMVAREASLELELQRMDGEEQEEQDQSQQDTETQDESPQFAYSDSGEVAHINDGAVDNRRGGSEDETNGNSDQAQPSRVSHRDLSENQRQSTAESTTQQEPTAAPSRQTVTGEENRAGRVTRIQPSSAQGAQLKEMWKNIKFYVRSLEGHNDLICDVDCQGPILVSGSRDTMLKLWDADTGREMRSMGGHTGSVTSVLLLPSSDMSSCEVPSSFRTDQYSVITGSKDCSIKVWSLANGQIKRSMYAFSPVECLDSSGNLIASGSEGGKVELWNIETGASERSVRGHEDAVTAVKFQDNRLISGSASGVVKVWDIRDSSFKPTLRSDQAPVGSSSGGVSVKPRRVRCLATTEETVYWGDDGVNMKAMDLKSGELHKVRNHVTEFGSTGAVATTCSCLVSAGYDLDRGNGYLNVRSLPKEEYLGTIDDDNTGCITCLSCSQTTRDHVTVHRMCTGGAELKLWDQLPSGKVKKRARPETDDTYVTAKHVRRYSLPDVSDTESSDDDDDQPNGDDTDDDDDVSTNGSASRSWCTIS